MTETYNIEFKSKRCWSCGSFWAFELSRDSDAYTCPRCNHTRMRELVTTAERQQRAINSLRGIITKLKTKKYEPR